MKYNKFYHVKQCCNKASNIFIVKKFLAKIHLCPFQISKNLPSFEDFRPKIPKIFWEKIPSCRSNFEKNYRKITLIYISNFERGQYYQRILIFWPKSSILRISSKKFLSSKIFQNFKESSFLSLLFFLNPKILCLRLRTIFNLRCNTD